MAFDLPEDNTAPGVFFGLRAVSAGKKLCAAMVFSLAVSLLARPAPALGACLFAALLLACSGLPPAFIARRLIAVNAFFLFLWLLLPLSFSAGPGDARHILGPLSLSASGVALALLVTLKGNAIAAALLALAGTSSLPENGHALIRLGLPEKLVVLLLVTHSNLERIAEEYQRVFQAARLRAFTPATTPASYRTYARLVGLLLVRSWQRTQRIETAMKLRGFRGRFPLIAPRSLGTDKGGTALLMACCAVSFALWAWSRHV